MLLTISTTHAPATDLGFLLHKNPSRAHSFELSFGRAHVVYPEASPERCTAALVLDVDPVGLVRGRRGPDGEGRLLAQYVNDRPYVASSFLSVAISDAFGTAMTGRSKERPQLAATPIPLEARVVVLPCRGGADLLRRLFEPLGYTSAQHREDDVLDLADVTGKRIVSTGLHHTITMERFVRGEPLRRVHECVFGVLAFKSEPVHPRLYGLQMREEDAWRRSTSRTCPTLSTES